MKMPLRISSGRWNAFTLIEIIVVITIVGIMIAIAVPGISSALRANKLTQSADNLKSQLSSAQQMAMKDNRPIQVRFFSYVDPTIPGGESVFRAYQFFRRAATDQNVRGANSTAGNVEQMKEITPLMKFSEPIVMSSNASLSSIAGLPKLSGSIRWGRNDSIAAEYVAFDFKPDGATNLSGTRHWFITLLDETKEDGSETPANFATVQVDPFTGSVRTLRP